MISKQVKFLKAALKAVGANRDGKLSVQVDRRVFHENGQRFVEYGAARSVVNLLSDLQKNELKSESEYIEIEDFFADKSYGFSAVKY